MKVESIKSLRAKARIIYQQMKEAATEVAQETAAIFGRTIDLKGRKFIDRIVQVHFLSCFDVSFVDDAEEPEVPEVTSVADGEQEGNNAVKEESVND